MAKKKPYVVLETDGSNTKPHTLSDFEWAIIELIFKSHPELITVTCPDRAADGFC
jgi:hypothetical protein